MSADTSPGRGRATDAMHEAHTLGTPNVRSAQFQEGNTGYILAPLTGELLLLGAQVRDDAVLGAHLRLQHAQVQGAARRGRQPPAPGRCPAWDQLPSAALRAAACARRRRAPGLACLQVRILRLHAAECMGASVLACMMPLLAVLVCISMQI